MKKSVFCLANDEMTANQIVDELLRSNFTSSDISVLYSDKTGSSSSFSSDVGGLGHEKNTKAPEGATTGAAVGGVVGGALGLLAGIGALAIPGIGPFIAAGPIMAALSGTALGGGLGYLTGALVGLGIPEYEAKRFKEKISQGNVLISVHVTNDDQEDLVKNIYRNFGAQDISSASETTPSKKKRPPSEDRVRP